MISINRTIPLSVPFLEGNEWRYLKECLDTGWVSSLGSFVDRFQEQASGYIGVKYGVAMVNGTSALHLSLIACDVRPDDEVIVPTLTFIAPVNVVKYCRAHPVFMDCDPKTLCIDVDKVTDFMDKECSQGPDGFMYNRKTERRVKAIIPVHVFGHPADMDVLISLSKKYNISLIEDASESLGSEYKGKKTGSLGAVGCFSFNGNKIITAGGGGMIVTNSHALAQRMRHLSTQAKKDPLEYDHDEVGYNYRFTNIQAALGVAQMERIDEFVDIKRENARRYRDLLSEVGQVDFIWEEPWAKSNFWFYTIKVPQGHRRPLIKYLLSRNIQVRPVWKLIHTLSMYQDCQVYAIENAARAYERCINLPCSVNLKQEEIEFVAESIKNYFSEVSIK